MDRLMHVKFDRNNLMVGRMLRPAVDKPSEWQGLYLHEGFIYTLPITAPRFNGCRDEVRKHYLNKSTVTLCNQLHSPTIRNWDIYGADDGWRMVFTYDPLKDRLTFTQPGKEYYPEESNAVQVVPIPTPVRNESQMEELPDFPVTLGKDHQSTPAQLNQLIQEARIAMSDDGRMFVSGGVSVAAEEDPMADEAKRFPAYWRKLPDNWEFIDYYRIAELFPRNDTRLDHALKKLLVCGVRTGGKSVRKDVAEAYATLGQWLKEHLDE